MHINPSMSGPVTFRRRKDGPAPGAIAFAGAEFVVVGKVVVGVEELWEVVAEVWSRRCGACAFSCPVQTVARGKSANE